MIPLLSLYFFMYGLIRTIHQVFLYKENMFFTSSVGDLSNALLLCNNCHAMFDYTLPAWTLLPNLEYFIRFEEEDFRQRQEQIEKNPSLKPARTCPDASLYLKECIAQDQTWPSNAVGGVYTQYWMPILAAPRERYQAWHGAPMAAILHAIRAINGRISPPSFVPVDVKKQLRHLQMLYEREIVPNQRGPTSDSSEGVELPNPAAPNPSPPAGQPSSSSMQSSSSSQSPHSHIVTWKMGPSQTTQQTIDAKVKIFGKHLLTLLDSQDELTRSVDNFNDIGSEYCKNMDEGFVSERDGVKETASMQVDADDDDSERDAEDEDVKGLFDVEDGAIATSSAGTHITVVPSLGVKREATPGKSLHTQASFPAMPSKPSTTATP